MGDKIERLIGAVYKRWKKSRFDEVDKHPGEEALACFLDGYLSEEENERLKAHLAVCDDCAEACALSLNAEAAELKEVPGELLDKARAVLSLRDKPLALEIFLRLKENILEIAKVNGDILLGQELVPAALLRSRDIKDFKDEVIIFKDFQDIRVEVKIENKGGKYFNVLLQAKHRFAPHVLKDLRVTLVQGDLELESYLSETGAVSFEHVSLGKYRLEITSLENRLASVILDVKA
ncbi:MAG: zf-HC2 domain-containing protein [Candidatus Omnitrophica bacterium]|nr:zf-HC2 domain-containing protein [Candidatus Omnitrophota bacterium]